MDTILHLLIAASDAQETSYILYHVYGMGYSDYIFFSIFRLRVRGQHTKTTGRRGRTVGVAKKK